MITRNKRELRLFLNGNRNSVRLMSTDIMKPWCIRQFLRCPPWKRVLVLGGGDGLQYVKFLKYPSVEKIDLVDLDAKMTGLFSTQEVLRSINQSSLLNKKVTVHNADALTWLRSNREQFDAVVIGLPRSIGIFSRQIYSTVFYNLLKRAMFTGCGGRCTKYISLCSS